MDININNCLTNKFNSGYSARSLFFSTVVYDLCVLLFSVFVRVSTACISIAGFFHRLGIYGE